MDGEFLVESERAAEGAHHTPAKGKPHIEGHEVQNIRISAQHARVPEIRPVKHRQQAPYHDGAQQVQRLVVVVGCELGVEGS